MNHTPFLTPFLTPYPASVSSGNAGDGDTDGEDSGSEGTTFTAFTRPFGSTAGNGTGIRSTSSRYRTPQLHNQSSFSRTRGGDSSDSSMDAEGGAEGTYEGQESENGSVLRRVITRSSVATRHSADSGGSVIRNENVDGSGVLPLPRTLAGL